MNRFLAQTGALLAMLVLLASCAPTPPTTNPPSGAANPPAAVTAAKPAKDELIVGLGSDPITLDSGMQTSTGTGQVAMVNLEGLLTVDKDLAIKPNLASEWKAVDPTTWQFKLRSGVKFQNGESLDAAAVKFSIDRVLNPDNKSLWVGQIAGLKSVDVVDPQTVNFVTTAPLPILPALMTRLPIVPPKYHQEASLAGFGNKPVGTGPFKFVEWKKDDRLVYEAYSEYWGGAPKLKRIVFKPIPEDSARVAALKSGTIDLAINVPPDEIDGIKAKSDLDVATVRSLSMMFMGFDTLKPGPVQDKRVRQALNYAVDKDTIVKAVLKGQGVVLKGQVLSPLYFGYNPNLQPYPYDPDKAKALLAEAGYKDGFELRLTTTAGYYTKDKEVSEAVAGQLAKVGVKATVTPLEYGVYIREFTGKTIGPLWIQAWRWPPDADLMFRGYLTGAGFSYYSNQEFDAAAKAGGSTVDPAERLKAYQKATEVMREDPSGLYLYEQVSVYGVSKNLRGFEPRPDERLFLYPVSFAP